jgi:hypothetical protein
MDPIRGQLHEPKESPPRTHQEMISAISVARYVCHGALRVTVPSGTKQLYGQNCNSIVLLCGSFGPTKPSYASFSVSF